AVYDAFRTSTCSTLSQLRLRCAPRSSGYAFDALHALRATSQSTQSTTAAYSRRATLSDFTSPPDVRLRS
ncbi:hypothetical protein AAVH_25385, partial [Aphelenchoides avenae]